MAIDEKEVNSAYYDDMWGETPEEEMDSYLVGDESNRYIRPVYFFGVSQVRIPALKSNPVGHYYKVASLPDNAIKAFERLVKAKKATLVEVKHANEKDLQAYYHITNPKYYILAHGVPNHRAIFEESRFQIGVAEGEFTFHDTKKNKLSRSTFCSVLAVEENLYTTGAYVDQDGNPIPINLHMRSEASTELHKALLGNFHLVSKALELGVPKKKAQYWAYAQELVPAEDTVPHGKVDQTDVFPIISKHPSKKDITQEYIDSCFCGDDLYPKLMRLVFDLSKRPIVPGGLAVDWCRDLVAKSHENVDKFTSPEGDRPKWGKSDPPPWFEHRDEISSAKAWMHGFNGGDSAPAKPRPAPSIAEKMEALHRNFFAKGDTEGVAIIETAREAIAAASTDEEKTALGLEFLNMAMDRAQQKSGY